MNLLVVKFRLVYANDSRLSNTVYACTWYDAPGIKSLSWYCESRPSMGIVRFVTNPSDNPKIWNQTRKGFFLLFMKKNINGVFVDSFLLLGSNESLIEMLRRNRQFGFNLRFENRHFELDSRFDIEFVNKIQVWILCDIHMRHIIW